MKMIKHYLESDNPSEYAAELSALNKGINDVNFEDNFNLRKPFVMILEVKKKKKTGKKAKYFIIFPGFPDSKKYLLRDPFTGAIELGSRNAIMENLNQGQIHFTLDDIDMIDPSYLNFKKLAFNIRGEEINYDKKREHGKFYITQYW